LEDLQSIYRYIFSGCYGAVHWSLCWRGLTVILSGLVF